MTMRAARDVTPFAAAGFRPREFFPHEVVWLAKPYPDAYLNLERRGFTPDMVRDGECLQINLYSDHLDGLPDALFTDPDVNWHGQQFGRRGLIAAAGLFVRDSEAFVTLLQSDLCQQVYRSPELKRAASARLNNRFRYWHLMLVNAALDFAAARGLATLHSPTAGHIVGSTRKAINPDLFTQIYDSLPERYACTRTSTDAAEYWTLPVADNTDRIVALSAGVHAPPPLPPRVVCLVHDTEENVDTDVPATTCQAALTRMLEIERGLGVRTTYAVLGRLFAAKAPLIAADDTHALAFHSFDHRLDDLTQLPRCREVDLQVKGYRPPQSRITTELSDRALTYWNFEWLLSSTASLGFDQPRLVDGLVKIPVHIDDYPLHTGELSWSAWLERTLALAGTHRVVTIGLHDCYASHWLEHYPHLLAQLGKIGALWTCEQIVDQLRFATALGAPS